MAFTPAQTYPPTGNLTYVPSSDAVVPRTRLSDAPSGTLASQARQEGGYTLPAFQKGLKEHIGTEVVWPETMPQSSVRASYVAPLTNNFGEHAALRDTLDGRDQWLLGGQEPGPLLTVPPLAQKHYTNSHADVGLQWSRVETSTYLIPSAPEARPLLSERLSALPEVVALKR